MVINDSVSKETGHTSAAHGTLERAPGNDDNW